MTKRLFDADSYIRTFTARVLSCEKNEKGFCTVLDQTAFFPEGGGQAGDTGLLDGIAVFDTQIKDGIILHFTEQPLPEGATVTGTLDWRKRFARMQNHTAEHILSGLVHKHFGYENVGFHLGEDFVTMDYDGVLSEEAVRALEQEANTLENRAVKAWYPDDPTAFAYRSKLDLKENVRLVEIPGVDLCACCAPHVKQTAEVGLIKVMEFHPHRGGVRVTAKAGAYALNEFVRVLDDAKAVAEKVSLPVGEAAPGVERLLQAKAEAEIALRQGALKAMEREMGDRRFVFTDFADLLKDGVNLLRKRFSTGFVGAFCGNDESGYRFMVCFTGDEKAVRQELKQCLNANGGGRDGMLQGKAAATRRQIEDFFSTRKND